VFPATEPLSVGDLQVVASDGGVGRGEWAWIGPAAAGDAGEVAFVAGLAGSPAGSGIVRVAGGSVTVLLRSGDPAPGGGRYATFEQLDLGGDGCLLFRARLTGCDAGEGVFLRTPDGVQVVARAGDRSPGGGAYESFGRLTITSWPMPTGRYFRLAFTARTDDRRQVLVIWPSYTDPVEALATGRELAGGVLERFVTSRLGLGLACVATLRRRNGRRRLAMLVSEDQLLWGESLHEGRYLAGAGRISHIGGQPAVHVLHGLLTVRVEDGGTVLSTCPAGGDPQVFAATGDPAPGLDGERIERFGPPVSNSGLPESRICGIASLVRLSGGADALWVGVFPYQQPMTGAAVVPLVAGDLTDDESAMAVKRFVPVKLTNDGLLLLRATLDGGGRTASGLVVVDRLLDWQTGS
jgi:hypothetical protein